MKTINAITLEDKIFLHSLMSSLASICDGARTQDAQGFNASHTSLGHTLAAMLPASYDLECCNYAYSLAIFYQDQLVAFGYSLAKIKGLALDCEEIEIAGGASKVKAKLVPTPAPSTYAALSKCLAPRQVKGVYDKDKPSNSIFGISWDRKDADFNTIYGLVKPAKTARWIADQNYWQLKADQHSGLLVAELVDRYAFDLSPVSQELLDRIEAGELVSYPGKIYPVSNFAKIAIWFDYDPDSVAKIKTCFNNANRATWDGSNKQWVAPISLLRMIVDKFPTFYLEPSLQEILDRQKEDFNNSLIMCNDPTELARIAREIEDCKIRLGVTLKDGRTPRDYQIDGAIFLLSEGKAIVADEPGLGKTLTALLAAKESNLPIIVVCPASVQTNWSREASTLDLVVSTYSWAKFPDLEALPPKFVLILDEAHYMKDLKSLRTKAAMTLATKATNVFMLTGTPLPNGRPRETYPLLKVAGHSITNNKSYYEKRYCDAHETRFGWDNSGASNLDEWSRLTKSKILIRKKEDCLSLPPLMRALITIDGDDSDKALYNAAIAQLVKAYKERILLGTIQPADALVLMGIVRRCSSMIKAKYAIEKCQEILDSNPNDKVLIFTDFIESVTALVKHFACDAIQGSVASNDRQTMVDKLFSTSKDAPRVLVTTRAGGEGLNIQATNHIIFVDRTFVPKDFIQVEGRCLTENNLVYCPQVGYNKSMSIKKISEINIGDQVLTHTGQAQTVTDKMEREHRGLMTEINYVGWFEPLTCTHDHKIMVKRKETIDWLPAHSILPGDYMVFPKQKNYKRLETVVIKDDWRVYGVAELPTQCSEENCENPLLARNLCEKHYRRLSRKCGDNLPPIINKVNSRYKPLPKEVVITDEWLYLMGWYVAEGFPTLNETGKGKGISCSGHEKELAILENIAETLKSVAINSRITRQKNSKAIELRAYSRELSNWFHEWFGRGSKNLSLPQEILSLPPDQAAVFLRGYTDGDGYQRRKQVEWVSASYTLCYQMCLMAISAGFIPNMRKVIHPITKSIHWVAGYTKFSNSKYHKRVNNQDDHYIYKPITKVKTYYDKIKVYDVTVAEDHSFTTGFAIAHNCHRSGQAKTVFSYWLQYNDSDRYIDDIIVKKQKRIDLALEGERKTMRGIDSAGDVALEILHSLMKGLGVN